MIYTLGLLILVGCYSLSGNDAFLFLSLLGKLVMILLGIWLASSLLEKMNLTSPSRVEHSIIIAFILFLLFDPSDPLLPIWFFFALGALAQLLRQLIRTPGSPLFNSVALATLGASIFGYFPSWWGASFSPRFFDIGSGISIAAFIILPLAGYVTYRYRKHLISITTFVTFCLVYFFLFQESPLYYAIEGTLFFFLLIMAVEPKTSPVTKKEQIVYGILVGTLIPLGIYFHFIEAYIIALLIGNLYTKRAFLKDLFVTKDSVTIRG